MKIIQKHIPVLCAVVISLAGCAVATPPPVAFEPVSPTVSLEGNYDAAWNAVLSVIDDLHGVIIVENNELGFISFYQQWGKPEKTFFNIYVQRTNDENRIVLHQSSWVKGIANMDGKDLLFIKKVKEKL